MMRKTLLIVLVLLVAGLAVARNQPAKPLLPRAADVRADEVEPNDDCASAGVLTDAMNGEITAGDQDWFAFEATAGMSVTFETMVQDDNPSMDTRLYLYADECETELAYDDDGGEGLFSLIQYIVDGYSGCGLATVTTELPVAAEGHSWTDVKGLYR
ncbi:hypothetical protein GF314_00350 [bacterium]|nr:hypothetical protein [bacterium]